MSHEIQALLIERAGYIRRGLKDRVKQVDDALAALGYKQAVQETASVEPESERATVPRASKRKG